MARNWICLHLMLQFFNFQFEGFCPQVGVDPLVRQKVWEHLLELSRVRGTTTIITTHYVEEARGAARVGFMRDGRLLAEDSPEGLLATHGVSSLEAVFLVLCQVGD